jgi:hypothetical protein
MMEYADGNCEKEAVVAFSGYMAFRVSEGRRIKHDQIDVLNWELVMIGKGGQVERFPIPKKARLPLFMAATTAEQEGREFIISASDRTVRGWWSELLSMALGRPTKKDGTEGTHAGRHSVGTDTYNNTKDLVSARMASMRACSAATTGASRWRPVAASGLRIYTASIRPTVADAPVTRS